MNVEEQSMVRVGLIGFGLAGQAFHAPVIRGVPGMELACILERHTSNAQKKYPEAIAAYNESAALAKSRNNHVLAGKALINAAKASMQNKQYKEAKALLDNALDEIRALEPSHDKASGLITIGLAYDDLRSRLPDLKDSLLLLAHQTFTEAGTISDSIGDRRTSSYAWGYLGKLYEDERRYDEALQLTRRATFAAQQINAPESLYRWEWQTGRLLQSQNKTGDAITAYRTVPADPADPRVALGLDVLRRGAAGVCAVFAPSQVSALDSLLAIRHIAAVFAAIGATTATALRAAGAASVVVAESPTPERLAKAVAAVYPRRS